MYPRHQVALAAVLLAALPTTGRAQNDFPQEAFFKASNTDSDDYFGTAIAISGNTLVVGAPYEDSASTGVNGSDSDNSVSNSGAVYVFVEQGGVWAQEAYIKASNTGAFDLFGSAVALSGDTLVVGAPGEDSQVTGIGGDQSANLFTDSGAAYVFERQGTTWVQTAYIKSSNSQWFDGFGSAVATTGATIAISSPGEDGSVGGVGGDQSDNSTLDSGAVYVFDRIGTSWTQTAYIKAPHPDIWDVFGQCIALDADRMVVGTQEEDSQATGIDGDDLDNSAVASGAAFIFSRAGGAWHQEAYLKASNTGAGDRFGTSVALAGDRVLVGAYYERSNAIGVDGDQTDNSAWATGAAYLFENDTNGWAQMAYLKPHKELPGIRFGRSVALDGQLAIVDSDLIGTGKRGGVFRKFHGHWLTRGPIGLLSPVTLWGDNSGLLAAAGGRVMLSAPRDGTNATGVDGKPSGPALVDSGAVYAASAPGTSNTFSYGAQVPANSAGLALASPAVQGTNLNLDLSGFGIYGLAMLGISLEPAATPLPGALLLIDLGLSVFGPSMIAPVSVSAGKGSYSAPLPLGSVGIALFCQAAMVHPSEAGGLRFTNGLAIEVGP